MEIQEMPLSELVPYANNPRKNKRGVAAQEALEATGYSLDSFTFFPYHS
jgi:hypothetical protein